MRKMSVYERPVTKLSWSRLINQLRVKGKRVKATNDDDERKSRTHGHREPRTHTEVHTCCHARCLWKPFSHQANILSEKRSQHSLHAMQLVVISDPLLADESIRTQPVVSAVLSTLCQPSQLVQYSAVDSYRVSWFWMVLKPTGNIRGFGCFRNQQRQRIRTHSQRVCVHLCHAVVL